MAYTYGSVSDCTYSYYECRLGYQVNSQDITNNTSNVTLRLEVRSKASSSSRTYGYNQTTIIDGTSLGSKTMPDMRNSTEWKLFGERTITIAHNTDGTCSVSKSASFTTTATGTYSLKSGSASVTVAPATIPRATTPTVSSSSVNMGSSVTISTPRASSSFTHTLTYVFGSASGTIATGVTTSYAWTPPLSLANYCNNGTSASCAIYCYTYNGNTLIGTKSLSITLNVPSSVVPTISSVTLSEGSSSVPSSWGVYVQNRSKLHVVTTASGAYSSTITSYKITGIDNNTYNSSNFVSNTLTQYGTKTITVTVTDSRGRTATTTTSYTCLYYANPSISSASAVRCLSDGTTSEEGTYLKYTFKANVSSVSNKNSHTYKIGYKVSGASSYTYVTISDNTYSLNKENVVLSGVTLSADNAYDIEFYVGDYYSASTTTRNISTAFALMNFRSTGKGMAIGKVSEKDAFEVAMAMELGPLERYSGDLNDVSATCAVYCNSASNTPDGNNGYCITLIYTTDYKKQIFYRATTNRSFERIKNGGTWSSWITRQETVITNTNGTAIKFPDGVMICYHRIQGNSFNCSANISGRFYYTDTNNSSENVKSWDFPQQFINPPIVNVTVSSNAYSMTSLGTVTNSACGAYCVLPYPVTSTQFSWNFVAIGKWK